MSEINYMKRILVNSESKLDFSTEQCIEKLRVNLNYCGSDKKAILLTSSVPEEGKSFIAFNLWKSLAKSGKRVLLIDCDLRKSQMVKDFKFHFYENDQVTLADVLAEHDILQNAIYKTDVKNGYIIPTVTKISNASLLLSNGNFEKIITAAKKIFDYIIIDTPPLSAFADAMEILNDCDGSIIVVRNKSTSKRMVKEVYRSLQRSDKPVLGTVLNRVDTKSNKHGYYGYYNS